jgi:hypothetical protein
MKLEFLNRFSKNIQVWNFTKIRPAVAELLHVDEKTARHKEANSLFSQFCEGAYKPQFISYPPSQIWLKTFCFQLNSLSFTSTFQYNHNK